MGLRARGEQVAACIAVFAVVGWMGCGGKSADGIDSGSVPGATFATSVDGGALVNGLTPAQATQLCADINHLVTDGGLEAAYCNALNLTFAVNSAETFLQDNPSASTTTLQAKCESYLELEQSGACTPIATCDVSAIGNQPAACMATVSDAVTCINENAMTAEALGNVTPSCASLSATILNRFYATGGPFETYNITPNSASCAALVNCRGLLAY